MAQRNGISTIEALKERCVVDDITGCWKWTGAQYDGNPYAWHPVIEKRCAIGKLICWLKTAKLPAQGEIWHRTCDCVGCVNPDHYRKGNRSTLMKAVRPTLDTLHKARITAAQRARSRFTDEMVREIQSSTEPDKVVAGRFNTSPKTLWYFRNVRTRQPISSASVFGWRPTKE